MKTTIHYEVEYRSRIACPRGNLAWDNWECLDLFDTMAKARASVAAQTKEHPHDQHRIVEVRETRKVKRLFGVAR